MSFIDIDKVNRIISIAKCDRFDLLVASTISTKLEDEINSLKQLSEELKNTREQIEDAEKNYNLNKAAELKYGKLHRLEAQIEEIENTIRDEVIKFLNYFVSNFIIPNTTDVSSEVKDNKKTVKKN